MMVTSWTDNEWLAAAHRWISDRLDRLGMSLAGQVTQPHIRPWSTVLRVPTDQGALFFKAASAPLSHEPRLTRILSRWRPDCMPDLLAADEDAGWMLLRDMGDTLRSTVHQVSDLAQWDEILRLYATIQMEMADRTELLLQAGALDRRLTTLPAQLAALLADDDAVQLNLPEGLSVGQRERLRLVLPTTEALCQELASYGISETIHHEDFHDANVFLNAGKVTLSDWAESGISHPFCSLLVTLSSAGYRLQLEQGSAELNRLRDVYLEMWSSRASKRDLLRSFGLAHRLGMICRALTWRRVTAPLPAAERAEHGEAVPGWLLAYLDSFQEGS